MLFADCGYDGDAIREDGQTRGATPDIPIRKNRRVQHSIDCALYAPRSRIDRLKSNGWS